MENPGLIVMVRPDSSSVQLNAFVKRDGEKLWSKHHESCPIPIGIMLSGYASSVAAAGALAATADAGATVAGAAGGAQEESMNSS